MSEQSHDEQSETPDAAPPAPERSAAPSVEALMGLRDFLAVAPRRRTVSGTQASFAALQRWMRLNGHDANGFYPMAQWQTFMADMLASTSGVTSR